MRRMLVGAVLVVVVGVAFVRLSSVPVPARTTAQEVASPALEAPSARATAAQQSQPSTPAAVPEASLLPALEDVAASCGLEARPFCQGGACVALARMPDLDHLTGWFSMAFRNPRFVWSVARRDLGIPEEVLSCGVALEHLERVATVELPDGSEIWCTFDGSESQAALCDRAASQRYGLAGSEFQRSDLRYLSFSR